MLAPNPGPMTLDGTNTWVLGAPGAGPAVVVDPGPDDEAHLRRVLEAASGQGGVGLVVLTHRHADHSAGARRFAALAGGPPVRAADPALQGGAAAGTPGLADGDELALAGGRLVVVAAPGHTADSVCLLLEAPGGPPLLLTGDTVLGRGTSVVAHPDGDLRAYLATLERLSAVVAGRAVAALLPGHGPLPGEPGAVLARYAAHRRERLAQVRRAVAGGARTAADVVAVVYPGLAEDLRPAAERSTRAALAALAGEDGTPDV
ncbi:MBL fold metallo-hydrolase [uncultured Pseudokineococcus sp.]|uniref:MBL fold metallo-hydrolase n=1 Tax=uncultured Pseudokineococcus sp. TaxID=1642928 RepID=UPI00263714B8|nr:MBL fold metallo-hydrolase [uncultured Pseudokineococcus sp.]